MLDWDPARTWKPLKAKLDATADPRHRRMLAQVLAHARSEVEADLEGVLATLAPEPVYRYMPGHPNETLTGLDAVRDFYANDIFGAGRHVLEGNDDRIVVDDHTVITEGTMRVMQWGRDLIERGIPVDDPQATYLMSVRLLIVWPFDDNCKIIGEESWSHPETTTLEKIAPGDVPKAFRDYITTKQTTT